IKKRIQAAQDRKNSYADGRRKPLEFKVGEKVMLKKYFVEEPLAISLDEIQIDDKLNFIEETIEIIDREVKQLKQSRIPIMKVSWNSRRGPEFTWECEDQMKKKYPHLFVNPLSRVPCQYMRESPFLHTYHLNLKALLAQRIFKSVGLRWIPIGKLFDSCTSKVDSESPHGSIVDIPNIHKCNQTLDVSACTSINVHMEQSLDLSAEVPTSDLIVMTSMIEFGSLFSHLFEEYFNEENQVVSKSFAVTTADASDKRQQQPDSTSSTSTLATTVTTDGTFDL
nr:hypothetical protein [Tanacetum cinerariifolium]